MTNKPFYPRPEGIDDIDRYLSQGQWLKVRDRLNSPLEGANPERIAELRAQIDELACRQQNADTHLTQAGDWDHFAFEAEVLCPRCDAPGRMTTTRGDFTCVACLWRPPNPWASPVTLKATGGCPSCYRRVSGSLTHSGLTRWPPNIEVTCDYCAESVALEVTGFAPTRTHRPVHPYRGLPLRLAIQTRHGWLYVFNLPHLYELRALVRARLREVPERSETWPHYYTNWANRLPRWITSAKNRAEVLAALDKLERMAQPHG